MQFTYQLKNQIITNLILNLLITTSMTSLKYSPQTESNPENNFSRMNDTIFTKELLKRLEKYNDDEQITLEESIPILYDLNIFQQLTSIPEAKKRLTRDSGPNNRLQLQARFIYNLWKMISSESIPMSYFKQIVILFITEETSDLALKLEQHFENEKDVLIQILAIWEAMIENNSHQTSYQDFKDSSVLTEQEANFNQSRKLSYNHQRSSKSSSQNYPTNSIQRNRPSLNKKQKQNQREPVSISSKTYTERYTSKTRRQNIEEVRNQMFASNLYQLPVLSVQRQKELINRLYIVNKYDRYQEIKKIQDEQKILKEMQQCTFRPNIEKVKTRRPDTAHRNKPSKTQGKVIPGFEKAIERMKIGQEKTKQLKQKLQLRKISVKQNKQENLKAMVPPKFLTRETKKEEKKVLFTIQFDIGRHKLTCKIHQNQSAEQLAKNIQSIYSLKQESYEQIKEIIDQQIERYFEINNNEQDQNQDTKNQVINHEENLNNSKSNTHNFIFC